MGLISPGGENLLDFLELLHVLFPPELKQQIHASLPVDKGICGYPSRLSHEASHRFVPRATVV